MATKKKQVATDVVFRIRRFDPDVDEKPHYEGYKIHVEPGLTILDGLHIIRETIDHSLAWRYSCRMGVCGSCAMMVNGRPMLACNNQILDISTRELVIAPLVNFDIVKDLVPDLTSMFDNHIALQPYLIRDDVEEMEKPTGEYMQSEKELVDYLQFTYCIRCGACMAACPTLATDAGYLGPMPLGQAFRWTADTRDEGFDDRKDVAGGVGGTPSCHYAGECSNVCPKGVDPAKAIQLMKVRLVKDYFKLLKKGKKGTGAKCIPVNAGRPRREEIPEAPPYTVEQK
jgi:succinate dehydrogenase / fumarate reductase iron-sulfur subunit